MVRTVASQLLYSYSHALQLSSRQRLHVEYFIGCSVNERPDVSVQQGGFENIVVRLLLILFTHTDMECSS